MIRATEADRSQIEAFLAPHAPFAMFPLNNLAHYGMAGGSDYAVTCWIARRDSRITDVMTLCDNGMAMPFLPSADYAAAVAAMEDRPLMGIIGPTDQVRGVEAQGFADAPRTLDHDEPHFLLELDRMTVPDGPGMLRPLQDAPADVIKGWMLDYQLTALNTPAGEAGQMVESSYANYVARDSHRVLMEEQTPLAMTGFNAQLPDIVQIGGVYTPPDLRGRGHARRALALHLVEAAMRGVTRATLFSASDMAARAYRAIGFERIGDWTLLLFDGPQRRVVP